jgi:ABC-2 type transport system permease protein
MQDVITLLKPRMVSLKKGSASGKKTTKSGKLLLLGIIGAVFWFGLFGISLKVLLYFQGIEDIGDILNFKLLSMMLITAFALLIFSSILTSLSKLYLSRDLLLVHSLPVACHRVFLARWIDSTIDSSWMVVIFSLPVFISFGLVYTAGPYYYVCSGLALISLALIASALAVSAVTLAVRLVPASRMKSIFVFLGILFFVVLYLAVRLLKPELLVDPEVFDTVMVYISAIQTPSSPLLPSTWAFDAMKAAATGTVTDSLFHLAISLSCAGALIFGIILMADLLYYDGFSKTQTAQVRLIRNNTILEKITGFLPGPTRAYIVKEIKSFFRDQSQWSQLFLIAALVVIYVYNFKVLPLDKSPIKTVYLQNLLSFLNMGLALFVLTAVAGRFAFPAVSSERDAFWIVRMSPASIGSFLWIKFFVYYLPLLILTEILIVATNLMLNVTPFMMALSTITVFVLVPGIVAMGIGFGAAYPDFKAENPAQTVTSFGGLVFMIFSAGFILLSIVIEAGPVYHIFVAGYRERALTYLEWVWVTGSFAAVLAISVVAVLMPMRFGRKKLVSQRL